MKFVYGLLMNFLLIVLLVVAVPHVPQGDVDLKNTYGIFNATSVNATKFYVNGALLINWNITGSNYIINSSDILSWNETKGNITYRNTAEAVNWTFLQNYPSGCPSGTFVTTNGDSNTCTAPTAADVDAGTYPAGDYVYQGNINISSNNISDVSVQTFRSPNGTVGCMRHNNSGMIIEAVCTV